MKYLSLLSLLSLCSFALLLPSCDVERIYKVKVISTDVNLFVTFDEDPDRKSYYVVGDTVRVNLLYNEIENSTVGAKAVVLKDLR